MRLEANHAVAEIDRLLEIVGDEENDRLGRAGDFEHFVLKALAGHRVEGAKRLVHHQRGRLLSEAACDLQSLLHAAGHLRRIFAGEGQEADAFQERGDPLAPRPARRPHRLERQRDVALRRAPGQQRLRIVLEDDRDVPARSLDRRSGEGDLAAGRGYQSGGYAQRRRLAAAGRTDDADDLAPPDIERELAKHEMIAEGEIDRAELDQRRRDWDHETRLLSSG